MGWFRTLASMFSPRKRAEEAVKKQEEIYQKVKQAYPELEPHDHLAQVWLSRMSAADHKNRNLNIQEVAYRVTKQFACVPPPECVRALAMHMVNIEDQESFQANPRFQKEFAILMTPVFQAKEIGTMHELYAKYNPNRAAESGARVHYSRSGEHEEDENHDLAITDYNKAIELDPNDAKSYLNRGYTYKEQGKKAEAIADFEKFIALTDNLSEIQVVQRWIEELVE